MRCRALVKDDKNKQNIVWFGSYGINKNYIKKVFLEAPDAYKWQEEYNKYYVLDFMTQNVSSEWNPSSKQ